MKNAITLTVVSNMTSNYSEGLGNIASIQKVFREGKVYAIRSRESLKNAMMVQSGWYDDLETEVNGATQKKVNENLNAANCRALEGGYMNTGDLTYIRNSSFYLTDAIACNDFVNETRFHNNLFLASNYADRQGWNLQEKGAAANAGLMPYQYEYDKSLKVYSITIDLSIIGKDENFNMECSNEEKFERVKSLLKAVQNLSMVVKGNMDNSEPLFIVGGLSERKTHYFENVIRVKDGNIVISEDLKSKVNEGYRVGLLDSGIFKNAKLIKEEFHSMSINDFFNDLIENVRLYYKI